jgi:hypothetical protein
MDIKISEKKIWLGEEARPFLSGELHYWRLPPSQWRTILKSIHELGLDFVSTYICWHHHELADKTLDFHGKTDESRNLIRFLELVNEEGFWLAFRPGPYIYSEWANNGVPDRVAHLHRLHPEFKQAASTYMAAVVEVAKPYFGKPIVLFQADNEPDAWGRFYETQLGLGTKAGFYQDWLKSRYEDIASLNEKWETNYDDFSQARAATKAFFQSRGYHNRFMDYRRFVYWYTSEISAWTAEEYRRLGVNIPIYTNHYAGFATQHWRELAATVDMSGPDYYATNEFRRDAIEHQEFLHQLRYTRSFSPLPCIPEFQAGIWHEWHYKTGVLSPRHYLLSSLSALLAGTAGWNWYMMVNRDNWYMSPINEWGRKHPELAEVFAQIISLFRELDPGSLEKLTDTAIVFDQMNRSIEVGTINDHTLRAIYQAAIDYECCDPATGKITKPLSFYSGNRWMSQEQQEYLLSYVENGGNLVFFQQFPSHDEFLNPLNLLGLKEAETVIEGGNISLSLDEQTVSLNSPLLFSYETVNGEPLIARRRYPSNYNLEESKIHSFLPIGNEFTVGYQRKCGKGTITQLGLSPEPALILALHRHFNVPVYSHCDHVQTALFRRDKNFYLIAVNNGEESKDAIVYLHPKLFENHPYRLRDMLSNRVYSANLGEDARVSLHLAAKSGTVIEISE